MAAVSTASSGKNMNKWTALCVFEGLVILGAALLWCWPPHVLVLTNRGPAPITIGVLGLEKNLIADSLFLGPNARKMFVTFRHVHGGDYFLATGRVLDNCAYVISEPTLTYLEIMDGDVYHRREDELFRCSRYVWENNGWVIDRERPPNDHPPAR